MCIEKAATDFRAADRQPYSERAYLVMSSRIPRQARAPLRMLNSMLEHTLLALVVDITVPLRTLGCLDPSDHVHCDCAAA